MSRIPQHVIRGRCNWCGREVPGRPKEIGGREMEGACPRCGRSPLLLDNMGPWIDNIARMETAEALALAGRLEEDGEIEVLFRVEFLGPNRDEVLGALHRRYWEVVDISPAATTRGRAMTLEELRRAWARELEDPDSRAMYLRLAEIERA